jgi:hypothetical protein
MKVGDWVKCIKVDYIDGNGNPAELPFQIGKFYRLNSISDTSINIETYHFGLNGNKIYLRQFPHYFMTQSDWRDSQIDKIII